MDATEIWEIEGDMAAKAYDSFRRAWMKAAPDKRVETGEELEAMQLTFAARWARYRADGA